MIIDQQRLEEENRQLRKRLADLGVRCEYRRDGETLEQENRRLEKNLRWCMDVLKGP